ncbi:MAG: ABC transporter ATP-binding protein [Candidatus Omnitrophota bacterium]|nr:MAG: ABC transporter ATP-binding protein [Candidatus Omnitrophota bacterium]RKY44710.1 MAG: ABC transporter ATP-binding protein [Candidatus Omnitrophota bacterium]
MLETKSLVCGYDNFLLKGISFKVNFSELVGIIGPNGSGKTTLIRAITKLVRPKEGKIIYQGKDITKLSFKELAKEIAVVSQDAYFPDMVKVKDFVLLGRIPHFKKFQFLETNKDLEIVEEVMKLTGILEIKDRFLKETSGGERQLVLIARALAQEPKLLLLDEPTAYLDITHKIKILDLIRKLNKKYSLTVLIVLHDLNLASQYCDRLILLKEGKIYKIGTPSEVLTYQIIEEVYQTVVIVKENPFNFRPYVFLVSEEEMKRRRKDEKKRINSDLYR